MSQPPYPPPQHPDQPGMYLPPQAPAPVPIYKRTWFVVLALLLVVGAIGSAFTDDDEPATTAAATESSTGSSSTPQPETTAPSPAAVAPPATSTVPSPTQAAETDAGVSFVMPDFVGLDLQSAQNLVQTHGVWLSVSHDLLGSRNQVIDSNWVVCTQNIPVGQQVSGDVEGDIDFGVVKREERCP